MHLSHMTLHISERREEFKHRMYTLQFFMSGNLNLKHSILSNLTKVIFIRIAQSFYLIEICNLKYRVFRMKNILNEEKIYLI